MQCFNWYHCVCGSARSRFWDGPTGAEAERSPYNDFAAAIVDVNKTIDVPNFSADRSSARACVTPRVEQNIDTFSADHLWHLVSDFAGRDALGVALRRLGLHGSCTCFETNSIAKEFLRANHENTEVYDSVEDRKPTDHLRPILVVAGFPCQLFSALGLKQGWNDDTGRGALVEHTLAFN